MGELELNALNRAAGNWARADAENRELRELVREAYNVIDGLCEQQMHCYTCRFSDDRGICEAEMIRDRMSDLGIEVRG